MLTQSSHFNPRLESLRGLAALIVAVAHSFRVLNAGGFQAFAVWTIDMVFNGDAAVTVFFVLSGYVLGLGIRRSSHSLGRLMVGFGIRRVFRIYPMFFVSAVVVAGFLFIGACFEGLIPLWFNTVSDYRPTVLRSSTSPEWHGVFLHFLLWNPAPNPVTWTLGIELRCSLLLPLLHWCSARLSGRGKFMLLLGLIAMAGAGKWCLLFGWVNLEAQLSLWLSAFGGVLFLFYLGYLLPEVAPAVIAMLERRSAGRWLLFPGAPVILIGAHHWGDDLRILQGFAAATIIAQMVCGSRQDSWRWLDLAAMRFLGKISYGFYLWHDLILIVLARSMMHFLPANLLTTVPLFLGIVLLLLSGMTAIGVAAVCHRWIETPFINWGRQFTGWLCPSASTLRSAAVGQFPPDLPRAA